MFAGKHRHGRERVRVRRRGLRPRRAREPSSAAAAGPAAETSAPPSWRCSPSSSMHGYQIIRELSERTGGAWTPSPGSVYPTLQQLEDEELVAEQKSDTGRRVYELTEAGREKAAALPSPAPWEQVAAAAHDEHADLRSLVFQVLGAVRRSPAPARRPRSRRPRRCCARRGAASTRSWPRTPRSPASPRPEPDRSSPARPGSTRPSRRRRPQARCGRRRRRAAARTRRP